MEQERRIPVIRAVKLTYGLLGRFWWRAIVQNIGAVALLLAAYVAHEMILPVSEMMEMQTHDPADNLRASLLNLLYTLLLMVPWTMLFVAIFRIGISNEVTGDALNNLRWGKRETCVFLRGGLLMLILIAIAIPIMLIVSAVGVPMMSERMVHAAANPLKIWPFMLALLVFVGLPVGYLCMRWLPYVAAPALDHSLKMGASWRATTDNGWRMLAICILVYLPFMAFSILHTIAVFEYGASTVSIVTYISWIVSIVGVLVTSLVTAVMYDYLVPKQVPAAADAGNVAEGSAH